ncbi:MAG TPA: hypothetical protein VJ850_09425 [Candidatus Limnocylindrales bacterium]|nr:hypothetical protein [Candidatus Limnocylindrales bacterium]
MRNLGLRRSLDRAEQRILDNPGDMARRHRRDDGSIVDWSEPGILLSFEETDTETITWLAWHDVWNRRER